MKSDAGANSLPIALEGVTKRFGPVLVLDDVSLDVAGGEFVTLLGPSGSGKTTILNIIAGFTRPDRGRVSFGTAEVTLLPPHQRNLGVVFQNYALFPHMSVASNVAFPLQARRYGRAEVRRRIEWALELVQLAGYGERRIDQLSGGQRQRVALARALVFEPKIILMDEPLSALDKQLRELMQVELRRLHARIEATIIYVTHDQREALTMSDRIAVIDKGRVVQFGSPQSVYERPEHRFVAEFLGESALIPVERAGPSQVRLGDMILASERTLPDASGLLLVVRAETLSFAREGDVNRLPAIVSEVIYQGDSVLLMVTLAQRFQLAMRHPAHQHALGTQPAEGDPVTLALHPSKVIVIPS